MKKIRFVYVLLSETVSEFNRDNGMKLSAALSYYTIFSLAPMLLIILSVFSFFMEQRAFESEIFNQIRGLVGPTASAQLRDILHNARLSERSGVAAAIGIVTLFIGATGVFAEIQDSINFIWSIRARPRKGWLQYLRNRLLSFLLILILGLLFLVSLGINTFAELLSKQLETYFSQASVVLFYVLNLTLVVVFITALFTIIFKVLPDGELRWTESLAGAAFTAFLFLIGKFAISYYIGRTDLGATYGASASVIILLTWIYYSSIILYFGAEFTKVYSRLDGVAIRPKSHAVMVIRQEQDRKTAPVSDAG